MTLHAWRITKAKYADDAFSGEGARLNGGRWNSKGVRMVYTAEHESLAILEILVGLEDASLLPRYVLLRVEFTENLVETLAAEALPRDWRANPPAASTRHLGDGWAGGARSVVFSVPSAVVPGERNFLLNPLHTDFRRIKISDRMPFTIDPRLVV